MPLAEKKSAHLLSSRRTEIDAEQIRILYQQSAPGVIIEILAILIFNFLLINQNNESWQNSITGLILLNSFASLTCILLFKRAERPPENCKRWGQYLIAFNLVAGSLWGAFFFASFGVENPANNYFILFLVLAIIVASAPVLASYFAVYVAFAFPLTLVTASRLLLSDDLIFYTLGWVMPAALLVTAFFTFHMNRTWRQSILLRYENLDLVSELTKQKNEAERAQKEAEEANRSKSKFLAAASHDIRQPLHALSLFVETLGNNEQNPTQKKLIGNIKNSVHAMEGLFNTLLDISKLDAGVVQPKLRHISMKDILAPLNKEYAELAQEVGLSFKCTDDDTVVLTDPILLEVVIRNLVGNAIRYTEQGGVWVVCQNSGNGQVLIEVGDTGIGIPDNQHANIFNEFYQLNNPERNKTKGLGLGLAIVRRIISMLGYDLQIESKVKRGSRFTLTVPAGELAKTDSQQSPYGEIFRHTSEIPLHVLTIDDDEMVRESMESLLNNWGYRAKSVESETEAVELISKIGFHPDVIIADYQLHDEKTGVDAINRVFFSLGYEVPAVIITGDILPEHLQQAERSGFPVLHKPVSPSQLRTFLVRCHRNLINSEHTTETVISTLERKIKTRL